MEQLIAKYLKNELTEAEASQLKGWLEKDAMNRKVFENMVGHWHLSEEDITASKSAVLQRIKMSQDETFVPEKKSASRWLQYTYRVAAVLVLAIGLTLIWVSRDQWMSENALTAEQGILLEKEAIPGQKLTFDLPDGTIVKLNAGSKLTYPQEFAASSREVTLIGEAFFDVARDEDKPFKIQSKEVMVQVLGTSFNVRSYPDEANIDVAVKTGKVAVNSLRDQNQVILNPAQMASYSSKDQSISKKSIDANDPSVFGWVEKKLVLKDASFDQILTQLSRWYGVEFEVQSIEGAQKRFTANFKNPSLVKVMESISFAYGFEYRIDGNRVTIY